MSFILANSLNPSVSTPELTSTAKGLNLPTASPIFSEDNPPARNYGRFIFERKLQSNDFPVPPFPLSRRI